MDEGERPGQGPWSACGEGQGASWTSPPRGPLVQPPLLPTPLPAETPFSAIPASGRFSLRLVLEQLPWRLAVPTRKQVPSWASPAAGPLTSPAGPPCPDLRLGGPQALISAHRQETRGQSQTLPAPRGPDFPPLSDTTEALRSRPSLLRKNVTRLGSALDFPSFLHWCLAVGPAITVRERLGAGRPGGSDFTHFAEVRPGRLAVGDLRGLGLRTTGQRRTWGQRLCGCGGPVSLPSRPGARSARSPAPSTCRSPLPPSPCQTLPTRCSRPDPTGATPSRAGVLPPGVGLLGPERQGRPPCPRVGPSHLVP